MRYMPRIGDTIAIKKSLVFEGRSFKKGDIGKVDEICTWSMSGYRNKPGIWFIADRDPLRKRYFAKPDEYQVIE